LRLPVMGRRDSWIDARELIVVPRLDVELVLADQESLPQGTTQPTSDAAAEVSGPGPGRVCGRLHSLNVADHTENGGMADVAGI
jgi:hypothetical protein